jgi:hypothetical protein
VASNPSPRSRRGRRAADFDVLRDTVLHPDRACAALRGYGAQAASGLVALARAHGVEPWLADLVRDTSPPWDALAGQRHRFAAASLRARADLLHFSSVADGEGWAWLALKGEALAEAVYPASHLRYGVDLDILLEREAFCAALDVLPRLGWELIDHNWPLLMSERTGELRLRSPRGSLVDLHWHLLNDPRHRKAFPLDPDRIIERRRTLDSGVPTLGVADQFAHVALHGALAGANRLMWLVDVHLAARAVPSWPEAVEAVRRARAEVPVGLILERSAHWLGESPYPQELRATPSWQRFCRIVDRLSPLATDPGAPHLHRSLARSAQPTPGETVQALAGHGLAYLGHGAPRAATAQDVSRDPADPRSPQHDVPDRRARNAYIAMVRTGR